MLWLLFAVLGGLSKSLLDLLTKRLMKNLDEYLVTWAKNFFSLPFLFVLLLFFKIPEIKPGFWLIVLIAMPLEMIAMFMYMRAIKTSPLSLIIPLLGLTPIIMIFTSFLMINELPNTIGFIGILVIAGLIIIWTVWKIARAIRGDD